MLNRILFMVLVSMVSVFALTNPVLANFDDVPGDHWAYDAVEYLAEEGLVEGYPDGSFGGDISLSRYEFAMVIARMYDAFLDLVDEGGEPGIDLEAILDMLIDEFQPEIDEIYALITENSDRIGELEGTVGSFDERILDIADLVDSINSRFHPYGDIRLRFEGKYPESGLDTQRPRFRLRWGFTSQITDELTFGARFGSGSEGGITSTNRTIDDAFGYDNLTIDRAYMQYQPEAWPGFTLWGGKFSPPWHTTVLGWDSDAMVEGIAQHYNHDKFNFYLGELVPTIEGFYLVAQASYDDIFIEGLDAAVTYHFINSDAWQHIMADMIAGDLKSRFVFANLSNPTDYRAIEGYVKYSGTMGGTPFAIEGNYLKNLADGVPGASEWTQAAWTRLTINGKPSNDGDWMLRFEWGRTQANSVLSWLTDADRGSGDHEWLGSSLTYRLLRHTDLVLTYLTFDRVSTGADSHDLFQVDIVTKFK